MGRPPKNAVAATKSFTMRVTPRFVEALDELRGDTSKAEFIQGLVREKYKEKLREDQTGSQS